MALRAAAAATGGWRLDGHTLVVTIEPCTMCAGAITAARIARLVYGAADPKTGAAGSLWDVLRDRRLRTDRGARRRPRQRVGALLRDFFAQRRQAQRDWLSPVGSPVVESPEVAEGARLESV